MKEEEFDEYADYTSMDDSAAEEIRNVKVYNGSRWYVTIRLTDIIGAEIREVDDEESGKPIRGVFIPFKDGGVSLTQKRDAFVVLKAQLSQVPSPKYTHLLTQVVDKQTYMRRKEMGFHQGFVGFMRPAQNKNTLKIPKTIIKRYKI